MSDFAKVLLHQKLFGEMLLRFNLSAKDIGEAVGVSEVMISRFRNGKSDIGSAKLIDMLNIVPTEAKEWYLSQVFGASPGTNNLRSLVQNASQKEKAEILKLIAGWLDSEEREEPTQLISTI
ncbi:MAG: helix-turn-helix transcriptional regulator [Methylacidiphilales bacterium]|nr:helix-turn-helix transcriptional regulator [Candidatus Methylacidiphilales bacterium]NJR15287.1 helix-turn-helix transcriptional regulator [Calothrix sp. CSU_2_0]